MRLIIRRLMLAVALVAAAVMFVPAPAQAGGYRIKVCSFIELSDGRIIVDDCHWIEIPMLEPEGPIPPGCPECFLAFDFWNDKIDPGLVFEFHEYFNKGFELLAESHLTEDPKLAGQLRQASVEYFWAAAKAIEKQPIELETVGWADPKTGKFHDDPEPTPILEIFGKELAAGTTVFQEALGDPDPQPSLEAALAHYDTAIEALNKMSGV